MLCGTSVRKGWPLARKSEPFKVMDKGELSGTRPNEPSCTVLLKLGAMGSSCGSWRFLERNQENWWLECCGLVGLYSEAPAPFICDFFQSCMWL